MGLMGRLSNPDHTTWSVCRAVVLRTRVQVRIKRRTRLATCSSVPGRTLPHRSTSRERSTDRTMSGNAQLGSLSPPSSTGISGRIGFCCLVVVSGTTMASPLGPVPSWSTLMTSTGRLPACSFPRVGSRSQNQTSPCAASLTARLAHRAASAPTPSARLARPPRLRHLPAAGRTPHSSGRAKDPVHAERPSRPRARRC